MTWPALSAYFPRFFRRGVNARLRLTLAYKNTFATADGRIVLADIANRTGFFRVNGPDIPSDQRAFADGMRAVYGSLLPFLNLSEIELNELAEAARQEAIADAQEEST